MAEAVAALSLAANIIQVVDIATKVVLVARETAKAGSTQHNDELEDIASSLRKDNSLLKTSTPGDLQLHKLADQGSKIAQDVLGLIETLKQTGNKPQTWKSLRLAMKTVWSHKKIEETMHQLERMRRALDSHVLLLIKENLDSWGSKLDSQTRTVLQTFLDQQNDMRAEGKVHHADLVQRHQHSIGLADRHHAEIKHLLGQILDRPVTENALPQLPSPANQPAYDDTKILDWLRFDRMADRRDVISAAHRRTFKWVFTNTVGRERRWTNLVNWLETSSGIYWVSGKAGSGKSTLMKFITDDHRTKQALSAWASDKPLLIAQFYFWNSGTTLQKSLEGLLRGLLWELLDTRKDLTRVAFPAQELPKSTELPPSLPALKRAIRRLVEQESSPMRYCFMIDGLDEYEGDGMEMTDLALFLKDICSNHCVKALVASRPTPPLAMAFEHGARLSLHHLTHGDITRYVSDKITEHPRMTSLSVASPCEADDLIRSIVEKAEGVFIWVTLVVRSLLLGIQNHDDFATLRERLNDLPADLERLYGHMLAESSPAYREQASRILQVMCRLRKYYGTKLTVLELSFACLAEDTVIGFPIAPMRQEERRKRVEAMRGLLQTRCRGLLEMKDSDYFESPFIGDDDEGEEEDGGEVRFTHKSVLDFLQQPATWKELQRLSGPNFDANVATMHGRLMQFKIWNPYDKTANDKNIWARYIAEFWNYNSAAESSTGQAQTALLNELDRVANVQWQACTMQHERDRTKYHDGGKHWSRPYCVHIWLCRVGDGSADTFLSLAIRSGAERYVFEALNSAAGLPPKDGAPLLHYCQHGRNNNDMRSQIAQALLACGADPNQEFNGMSPLADILSDFSSSALTFNAMEKGTHPRYVFHLKLMIILLRGGAGIALNVDVDGTRYPAWQFVQKYIVEGERASTEIREAGVEVVRLLKPHGETLQQEDVIRSEVQVLRKGSRPNGARELMKKWIVALHPLKQDIPSRSVA